MLRNRWYNYLIGGVLGLLLTLILSRAFWPIFYNLLNSNNDISYFIGTNLTFIPIIISVLAIVLIYHKLTIKRVFYKRFLLGFFIWVVLQTILLIYTLIFESESIILNFNPNKFFIFLILSMILTPIQIATEEFIFRGYLLNGLRSLNIGKITPLLLSSFLFALPHLGNPEVEGQKYIFFLIYMTMGLLLGYLTVKYSGIEYALGIHFANNFFAINILNYPNSPLPSSPLFLLNGKIDPISSLIQTILLSIIVTIFIKKVDFLMSK